MNGGSKQRQRCARACARAWGCVWVRARSCLEELGLGDLRHECVIERVPAPHRTALICSLARHPSAQPMPCGPWKHSEQPVARWASHSTPRPRLSVYSAETAGRSRCHAVPHEVCGVGSATISCLRTTLRERSSGHSLRPTIPFPDAFQRKIALASASGWAWAWLGSARHW